MEESLVLCAKERESSAFGSQMCTEGKSVKEANVYRRKMCSAECVQRANVLRRLSTGGMEAANECVLANVYRNQGGFLCTKRM